MRWRKYLPEVLAIGVIITLIEFFVPRHYLTGTNAATGITALIWIVGIYTRLRFNKFLWPNFDPTMARDRRRYRWVAFAAIALSFVWLLGGTLLMLERHITGYWVRLLVVMPFFGLLVFGIAVLFMMAGAPRGD